MENPFVFKAEGANSFELTGETVTEVGFRNSSAADSNARARDTYQTITVKGRIRSTLGESVDDGTIHAARWALVPAVMPTAYQKVTATATAAGQTTRKYEFSEGFVVCLKERFSDQSGVGDFEIQVRQKKDQLEHVKVSGGYAAE